MSQRRRRGLPINGVLLLDKPSGVTSNGALQSARRALNANKAGHTGSLDPLASGLLPICLGEATKISAFLLDQDKRYQVTVQLGITTNTGDAEGEVLQERAVPELDAERIEAVLAQFRGDIQQVPPMYSALKHQGQRLYDLARQGVEVERPARPVHIYALTLLEYQSSVLQLDVHCSKGTYVRTLAEDIGAVVGCGAHVTALRRTQVGDYRIENAIALDDFRAMDEAQRLACLLPIDTGLQDFPALSLSDELVHYLRQGQAVFVPKAPTQGDLRLYDTRGQLIALGFVDDDGKIAPRRVLK